MKRESVSSRFTFSFYNKLLNEDTGGVFNRSCFRVGVKDMAKPKFDGVIEAVRYSQDGKILWVRAFLRRGPTWSDHVLLDRQALIQQLKSGKNFVVGHRLPLMAGTFETSSAVKVLQVNGDPILVTEDVQSDQDCLKDVPLV